MVSHGRGLESIREVAWCFKGQEVLVSVGISGWREGVLAMSKHVLGIASCEAAGLSLEVQENDIRFPLSQCLDGSLVDVDMSRVVAPPEQRL